MKYTGTSVPGTSIIFNDTSALIPETFVLLCDANFALFYFLLVLTLMSFTEKFDTLEITSETV